MTLLRLFRISTEVGLTRTDDGTAGSCNSAVATMVAIVDSMADPVDCGVFLDRSEVRKSGKFAWPGHQKEQLDFSFLSCRLHRRMAYFRRASSVPASKPIFESRRWTAMPASSQIFGSISLLIRKLIVA